MTKPKYERIMRLQMDRQADSLLITISPQPISQGDNEIQQKVLMMWLYKCKCKSFYFYMKIISL